MQFSLKNVNNARFTSQDAFTIKEINRSYDFSDITVSALIYFGQNREPLNERLRMKLR